MDGHASSLKDRSRISSTKPGFSRGNRSAAEHLRLVPSWAALTACGWAELHVSAEAAGPGAPPLPAHRPLQGLWPQRDWERGACLWGLRRTEGCVCVGGCLTKWRYDGEFSGPTKPQKPLLSVQFQSIARRTHTQTRCLCVSYHPSYAQSPL